MRLVLDSNVVQLWLCFFKYSKLVYESTNSSIAFLLSKSIATKYLPLYGPRHILPGIIAIPLL